MELLPCWERCKHKFNMTKEFEMEEIECQQSLFLTDLPIEMIIHILQFLPLSSKYRASMVCHSMYNIFNDPELWRQYEVFIESDKDNELMIRKGKKEKMLISKFDYPEDQDIIKVIARNPTFHRLEHLSILWPDSSQMLSVYQPTLPNRRMVLELVSHLKNLKSLRLRSTMLSNDLLKEFAHCERVDKLQLMKIYVTHGKSNPQLHIPFINPSSWKCLTDINPNFSVNCWVIPRVQAAVLSNMLTFDCPLSTVVFLEWSRVNDLMLESITSKYSKTLKRFELYCGLTNYDTSLIRMVEECTSLTHLVIKSCTWYGLHYRTVIELAKSRGSGWKTFQIDEKNVSMVDQIDHAENDEMVAHLENRLEGIAIDPENDDRKMKRMELKESLAAILGSEFVGRRKSLIIYRNKDGVQI
ncbi:uncharacterized protein LOC134696795 isoform X3 [Mytilus trossulus]|uniref:uncharacterized protein LOC134696795 isoform X3 n=1 Tax=Mytilus trossulus TaxID=6551 RepID=UPI003006B9AF